MRIDITPLMDNENEERFFFAWLRAIGIDWIQIGTNLRRIDLMNDEDFDRIKKKFPEVKEVTNPRLCEHYKDCEVK